MVDRKERIMEAARIAKRTVAGSSGSCEDTIKCQGNTLLLVFLKCAHLAPVPAEPCHCAVFLEEVTLLCI